MLHRQEGILTHLLLSVVKLCKRGVDGLTGECLQTAKRPSRETD